MQVNFKTTIPQVSRGKNSESYTRKIVSPTDSGEDKNSRSKKTDHDKPSSTKNKARKARKKKTITVGTWNIEGLRTKQKEIINEIDKLKTDIIVLTETKKKGLGEEIIDNYYHIWSGVHKHQQAKSGVSILIEKKWKKHITSFEQINERIIRIDINIYGQPTTILGIYAMNDNAPKQEKNSFCEILDDTVERIPEHKELLIIGDLNSRVGKDNDDVVGKFGEDTLNDNGRRLVNFCREQEYAIMNTYFQHKNIHKFTWTDPTRNLKSIIDLLIMRKVRKVHLRDVRVYRQA